MRSAGAAWTLAALATAAALGLAGCGGSEPATLSPADAQGLERLTDRARDAAARGDRAGTMAALEAFRERVEALQQQGALPAALAGSLGQQALQAEERVVADVVPPQGAESVVVPTPRTKDPGADADDLEERDEKKGKKDDKEDEHDDD